MGSGTCFAEMGNTVTSIGVDSLKIENLQKRIVLIFEPGLGVMVLKNKILFFASNLEEGIKETSVFYSCIIIK